MSGRKGQNGPLTLRCPKCKVGEDFRRLDRSSSKGLTPTGNTKRVGTYHHKHNVQMAEVRHTCGHVFWTNHPDARRAPR